jgi:prepilin-type processing-associated H-X9-DG protein
VQTLGRIPDRSAWPYVILFCINLFVLLQLVFYILEVGLRRRRRLARWFMGYLILVTCLSGLLIGAADAARAAARRSICSNNIKIIGLLLANYQTRNDKSPPAFLVDETGRLYHSWRALLLPSLVESETEGSPEYAEYRAILDDYRFDEPWDSLHNREVGRRHPMPKVFRCAESEAMSPRADYFMIVGPGYFAEPLSPAEAVASGSYTLPPGAKSAGAAKTLYPGTKLLGRLDIPDGESHTINLAECDSIGSSWLEPVDLRLDGSVAGVSALLQCSRRHAGGVNVGWCDWGSSFLRSNSPAERVQACLTRAGGELASRDALEEALRMARP